MGRLLLFAGFIIFVCYIAIGLFYVAEISWINTSFFIEDHFWLWSLIVCGALALFFFYASGKSFKDLKLYEAFFSRAMTKTKITFKTSNNNFPTNNKDKTMELQKKTKEFDLSQLTLAALTEKMAYEMTKPGPIFFKGWGNNSLRLDVERVRIIQEYIESVRSTADSLMELQADSFLSFEKIKALTQEKRNQLKKRIIDSKIAYDFAEEEYTHKIEMMRLERERYNEETLLIKAQREQVEIQNVVQKLKAEADYRLIIAKSEKEKEIANILAEAVKYYQSLPNVLKSYVAVQLGSDNSLNPSVDMELQDQLKEFIIRKHKAETEMLESEADETKAITDTNKAKYEREKKKYSNNGNV